MNKRIRFTVIFSAPNFPYDEVLRRLGPKLGEHFSGACCEPVDGIWSEDGHEYKSAYLPGRCEPGMRIVLSVMPGQRSAALTTLESLLEALKCELKLAIQWVHVEEEEVSARHFRLK